MIQMEAPGVEPGTYKTQSTTQLTHGMCSFARFRASGHSRAFIYFHSEPPLITRSCVTLRDPERRIKSPLVHIVLRRESVGETKRQATRVPIARQVKGGGK